MTTIQSFLLHFEEINKFLNNLTGASSFEETEPRLVLCKGELVLVTHALFHKMVESDPGVVWLMRGYKMDGKNHIEVNTNLFDPTVLPNLDTDALKTGILTVGQVIDPKSFSGLDEAGLRDKVCLAAGYVVGHYLNWEFRTTSVSERYHFNRLPNAFTILDLHNIEKWVSGKLNDVYTNYSSLNLPLHVDTSWMEHAPIELQKIPEKNGINGYDLDKYVTDWLRYIGHIPEDFSGSLQILDTRHWTGLANTLVDTWYNASSFSKVGTLGVAKRIANVGVIGVLWMILREPTLFNRYVNVMMGATVELDRFAINEPFSVDGTQFLRANLSLESNASKERYVKYQFVLPEETVKGEQGWDVWLEISSRVGSRRTEELKMRANVENLARQLRLPQRFAQKLCVALDAEESQYRTMLKEVANRQLTSYVEDAMLSGRSFWANVNVTDWYGTLPEWTYDTVPAEGRPEPEPLLSDEDDEL
jgi:hypothetical protein